MAPYKETKAGEASRGVSPPAFNSAVQQNITLVDFANLYLPESLREALQTGTMGAFSSYTVSSVRYQVELIMSQSA